jgi:methyltransferase
LNAWMMAVRIPLEEKALKEHTEYSVVFKGK